MAEATAKKTLGRKEYAIIFDPRTGTLTGIWVGQPGGPQFYRVVTTLEDAERELNEHKYTRVSPVGIFFPYCHY